MSTEQLIGRVIRQEIGKDRRRERWTKDKELFLIKIQPVHPGDRGWQWLAPWSRWSLQWWYRLGPSQDPN